MTTLTHSQLETLRETGSVRVVVKMDPQPDALVFGVPCSYDYENEKLITLRNPLPSPGTVETIGGMECDWVERGCKQVGELTMPECFQAGLDPVMYAIDNGIDTYIWTAIVRRKDDGDEC